MRQTGSLPVLVTQDEIEAEEDASSKRVRFPRIQVADRPPRAGHPPPRDKEVIVFDPYKDSKARDNFSTPLKPSKGMNVVRELRLDNIVNRAVSDHRSKIDVGVTLPNFKELDKVPPLTEARKPTKDNSAEW